MTMRVLRRGIAAVLVASVWLAQAAPAAALLGWSVSGSHTAVQSGQETVATLQVSNDNLLSALGVDDIGCVHVDLPSSFAIQSVSTTRSEWVAGHSGGRAVVRSTSGGARLNVGESVTFSITALAQTAGTFSWSVRVIRDHDCNGGYLTGTGTFTVTVGPSPTPTPTPTPLLPLPSLPLPSLPAPTPSSSAVTSPSPTPRPSAPAPDESPSPTASPSPDEPSATPRSRQEGGDPVDRGLNVPAGPADGPTGGDGLPAATERGVPVTPDGRLFPTDPATGEVGVDIGGVDLFGDAVWAVPAATIAGPGLLVLLWLALQAIGAAAWMPSVRRLRGEQEARLASGPA